MKNAKIMRVIVDRPIEHFGEDLAGWLWSEKIDGFRCIWNGFQFQSRSEKRFDAPQAWVDSMPDQPLDGELFAGSWSATASAIKSGNWTPLLFYVFDVPEHGTLAERLAKIPALPSCCRLVTHRVLFSTAHALCEMQTIAEAGGEGIVCRPPNDGARAVKLKPRMDAEAAIIEPHFTSYPTIPGSYTLEANGRRFKATASGELIPNGSSVTFHFRGNDVRGKPRFATVKGPRLFD